MLNDAATVPAIHIDEKVTELGKFNRLSRKDTQIKTTELRKNRGSTDLRMGLKNIKSINHEITAFW